MLSFYGILGLIIAVIVRILIGHLSGKYESLVSWVPVFTYIAIGVAVILVAFIVINVVMVFKKKRKR